MWRMPKKYTNMFCLRTPQYRRVCVCVRRLLCFAYVPLLLGVGVIVAALLLVDVIECVQRVYISS